MLLGIPYMVFPLLAEMYIVYNPINRIITNVGV